MYPCSGMKVGARCSGNHSPSHQNLQPVCTNCTQRHIQAPLFEASPGMFARTVAALVQM